MDAVVAIGVLSKILGSGLSAYAGHKTPGFDEKDITALRLLLDASTGVLGVAASPRESEAAAQHLALITNAFGQAFGRHWAFNKEFIAPGRFRAFMTKEQKQRSAEIEARSRYAAQKLMKPGDLPIGARELSLISSLAGSPLNTPYYRAFWDAFSNPQLADEQAGEPPLLAMSDTTRREFERNFLLAYWEGLASPAGRGINNYLEGLEQYRAQLVRELLLKDLSTWNARHIFGNTERGKTPPSYDLPFLPLGEMYVEPMGRSEGVQQGPEPILTLINRVLRQPNPQVIFVKADFGSGKSLTARTLAYRLATEWLTTQEGTSLDQQFPIFIRCADDFSSEGSFELEPTVRRAWKTQASRFGLELKTSDAALELPEPEQRTTYILDGLDEVALGERRLDALMQRLQEEITDRHRFIIFSRPGALPPDHKLKGAIVVNLLPFTTHDENKRPGGQVQTWLDKWNRVVGVKTPLQPQQLADRKLLEVAKTPILLFMIAQSWEEISSSEAPKTLAEIYEGFFRHIARGKHEFDREQNTTVFEASNHLLEELQKHNELGPEATAPDAMLWLMSRVAWEATKLEQRPSSEPLTTRDVDRLLEDELELRLSSELTSTIRMGLLLAMQADLRAGADHILFGHKSFREFLVARYWADRLRKLISADFRDVADLERSLYGARLLTGYEKASLNFLLDLLNRFDPSERSRITQWARDCFDNEKQVFKQHKEVPTGIVRDDQRAVLREAALAIGCLIDGNHFEVQKPLALVSLLAWFVAAGKAATILVPGATLRGISLNQVSLFSCDFSRAVFEHASLSDARFFDCDFYKTRFGHTLLSFSTAQSCSFSHAVFDGARISSDFTDCTFTAATFQGSAIEANAFSHCALSDSRFHNTHLASVSLRKCTIEKVVFSSCFLQDVDFGNCDLSEVVFEDTTYTETVFWPAGFNPAETPGLSLHE